MSEWERAREWEPEREVSRCRGHRGSTKPVLWSPKRKQSGEARALFTEEASFCGPHGPSDGWPESPPKTSLEVCKPLGVWGRVGASGASPTKESFYLTSCHSHGWPFFSLSFFRCQHHSCFPNPEEEWTQRTLGKNQAWGLGRLFACANFITAAGRERLIAAEGGNGSLASLSLRSAADGSVETPFWTHGKQQKQCCYFTLRPCTGAGQNGDQSEHPASIRLCAFAYLIVFGHRASSLR